MKDGAEVAERYNEIKRRLHANEANDTAIQHARFGAAQALAWVIDAENEGPL